MIAPSKKSNDNDKRISFRRSTIRATNKTHPTFALFKIIVIRNRKFASSESKGPIKNVIHSKQ